jgi:hypothetical protein
MASVSTSPGRFPGRVHPHGGRFSWDEDADYPTTILVDRQGMVRWLHRSSVIARLPPDEVLEAIDQHMRGR